MVDNIWQNKKRFSSVQFWFFRRLDKKSKIKFFEGKNLDKKRKERFTGKVHSLKLCVSLWI